MPDNAAVAFFRFKFNSARRDKNQTHTHRSQIKFPQDFPEAGNLLIPPTFAVVGFQRNSSEFVINSRHPPGINCLSIHSVGKLDKKVRGNGNGTRRRKTWVMRYRVDSSGEVSGCKTFCTGIRLLGPSSRISF